MKLKEFKFDKGWKLLIYFDVLLPAVLFLLAWVTKIPQLSMLFHSYETFIVSPIPNFQAFTGILGLLFHVGIIGYTLYKKNYKDLAICLLITLIVAAFFFFEINYLIIKPLVFAGF